jgi:hypothetical protein
MITVKTIGENQHLAPNSRVGGRTVQFSDYELRPIGIRTSNIEDIVGLSGAERAPKRDCRANALTTRQRPQPTGGAGLGSSRHRSYV